MNVLNKILDVIAVLVKLITWIVVNGVPFLREIIEELKDLFKKDPELRGAAPGFRWIFKSVTKK
jgi:hypothetical protein